MSIRNIALSGRKILLSGNSSRGSKALGCVEKCWLPVRSRVSVSVSPKSPGFVGRRVPLFSNSYPGSRTKLAGNNFSLSSNPAPMSSLAFSGPTVPEVKFASHDNGMAVITLDRPKALNAMNLDMDIAFKSILDFFAADPKTRAVLVDSSSTRAFSAGGDVKWMTTGGRKEFGTFTVAKKVFTAEYSLICAISSFPKPYIALMDGVTMGFGLGLSGHGSHRVVTERSLLAMPENAIGLFPDVGFAHLAARTPGKGAVGLYMALTGARVGHVPDLLFSGLASHYVPSGNLPGLKEDLTAMDISSSDPASSLEGAISRATASFSSSNSPSAPTLPVLLPLIERCFGSSKNTVSAIVTELTAVKEEADAAEGGDPLVSAWASSSLSSLSAACPFSLATTLAHFSAVQRAVHREGEEGAELASIEGVMRQEYRIAVRTATRPDFIEGVRAVLVDKDQNPSWNPASLSDVNEDEVAATIAPFEVPQLELAV